MIRPVSGMWAHAWNKRNGSDVGQNRNWMTKEIFLRKSGKFANALANKQIKFYEAWSFDIRPSIYINI